VLRRRQLFARPTAARHRPSKLHSGPVFTIYFQSLASTAQDGGTVFPIANLIADFELESPVSYSSFLVIMRLSCLVSEIFACDRQANRQTDNADHYNSWPHIVVGQLIKLNVKGSRHLHLIKRLILTQPHYRNVQLWHALSTNHTVLPATHACIQKWNEPYLPLPSQPKLQLFSEWAEV